jgi:hypothetical protein
MEHDYTSTATHFGIRKKALFAYSKTLRIGEVAAGVDDVEARALTSSVEVLREPCIFARDATHTPRGTFLCGKEVEGAFLSFHGGGLLSLHGGMGCIDI